MAQNPVITITMENGDVMKAELYPEIAPISVNNFISLVKKGFYDGLIFHRVISGFMIQGGCPEGTGMGGPGYCIKGEFAQNGVLNSLKHTPRRTLHGQSHEPQFRRFPVLHHAQSRSPSGWRLRSLRQDHGGHGYVVDKIAQTDTDFRDRPLEDQKIRSITVETFGVDYPEPDKM